jgi:MFS transporter, DHA1 family, multidrug resistance protein
VSKRQYLLDPLVRWFLLGIVLYGLASNMFTIFIALYIAELGASVAQIGLALSLASLLRVILLIPIGWISDHLGRLQILAVGTFLGFLGLVGMIFARDWRMFLLALSLESLAQVATGPNFGAFLTEHARLETRGKVLGTSEMIFRIVMVVGPLVGGFLAGRWGIRTLMIFAALPYGLALILRVWMVMKEAPRRRAPLELSTFSVNLRLIIKITLAGSLLTWIMSTKGISQVVFKLSNDLLPLYMDQIGRMRLEQISLMGAFFGIAAMVMAIMSGIMIDRWGERAAVSLGFLLSAASMILLVNSGTFGAYAMAWIVLGGATGLLSPAYMSLIARFIPAEHRGLGFGFVFSVLGIAGLPATWVGGILWEHFSPQLPFLILSGACVLTAIISWNKLLIREPSQTY